MVVEDMSPILVKVRFLLSRQMSLMRYEHLLNLNSTVVFRTESAIVGIILIVRSLYPVTYEFSSLDRYHSFVASHSGHSSREYAGEPDMV